MSDEGDRAAEIHYHLELTPAQLKITHTALRSLLDDFGHEEAEVGTIVREILEKLPDEHAIRAIVLRQSGEGPTRLRPGADEDGTPPSAA